MRGRCEIISLKESILIHLRAILSPLLWHMKSTAESIMLRVTFRPDRSPDLTQWREASRKFSMQGRVSRTGCLKNIYMFAEADETKVSLHFNFQLAFYCYKLKIQTSTSLMWNSYIVYEEFSNFGDYEQNFFFER